MHTPDVFSIELKENTRPYYFFLHLIAASVRDKAEIDKMLALRVIGPVGEWCLRLTITPKAKRVIRMCVDLTNLNKGSRGRLTHCLKKARCS